MDVVKDVKAIPPRIVHRGGRPKNYAPMIEAACEAMH